MAKRKTKELLLAEIAYAAGRKDTFANGFEGSDEQEIVSRGAELALAEWKEQSGGRKPPPTDVERARKKWMADGSPPEGTWFPEGLGRVHYKFLPDGNLDLLETFAENIGTCQEK